MVLPRRPHRRGQHEAEEARAILQVIFQRRQRPPAAGSALEVQHVLDIRSIADIQGGG
jgi:hypothetical protein